MVSVKDLFCYFRKKQKEGEISSSLKGFLDTVPGYIGEDENGIGTINMSIAMQVTKLCDRMAEDMLLIKTKTGAFPWLNEYMCVHENNSTNPAQHLRELDYGTYDFKYYGLSLVYERFKDSIVPITGIKPEGKVDLGTAYYIGEGRFATAAHCIMNFERFKVLLHDGSRLPITKVSFAKNQNKVQYDLAVIYTDAQIRYPELWLDEPEVLDNVITMGYPSVPCFDLLKVVETASVGVIIEGGQKSVIGQVVAPGKSYMSPLDYFLINARVKGGNSGGPVINCEGKVIGTIVEIPFESAGSSDSGRYDIMGFGVCLPSKYITQLMATPEDKGVMDDGEYYRIA